MSDLTLPTTLNHAGDRLPSFAPSWRTRLLCFAGLLLAILAAHGIALWDGVFFDDHWHRFTLTHYGWGWSDLVESNTFNLPGYNNLWWQIVPMEWRYARPLWMLMMKMQHLVTGGDPFWIHAFGLLWAWMCTVLVFELALFAGLPVGWAFFAGMMFVINPHSIGAVSWNACRNTMMGDFFLLCCVLIYARASFPRSEHPVWRFRLKLLAIMGLWITGLFIREANVILPALLFTLDLFFGGWGHVRKRWPFHFLMFGLDLVYLVWRMKIFAFGHPAPPKIYFYFEPGWNYLPWMLSKLMQTVFCHVAGTPPVGGLATHRGVFWLYHAPEYIVITIVLILVAFLYAYFSKGQRGRWYWPTWIVLLMLPVVPISLLPYLLYTSFAGLAIMTAIVLYRLNKPVLRRVLACCVLGFTLYDFVVYRILYQGMLHSEQMYYQDIFTQKPDPKPGDTVFFINQPVINLYAPLPMRAQYGFQDLHGWALTLADFHIMMRQPSTLEVLNDRELLLTTPEPGAMSSIVGQYLIEESRPRNPLTEGETVRPQGWKDQPNPPFDVTVVEASPPGFAKLKFSFKKPLNSPDYHFYFTSPQRPAYKLDFTSHPAAELSVETRKLFEQARGSHPAQRAAARKTLADIAGPLTVQVGSPLQFDLADDPEIKNDALLDKLDAWWRQADVDSLQTERLAWLARSEAQRLAQKRYLAIQTLYRSMVKSDLILTGSRTDPYPDKVQWPWRDR